MGEKRARMMRITPFNSPLEVGTRILVLLGEFFPRSLDVQKIMRLDYLMVHSGDLGGPQSLHTPVPHRSGELLVKHDLTQRGLYLMMSKNMLATSSEVDGFKYQAEDAAGAFLSSLNSPYYQELKKRAEWVHSNYAECSISDLDLVTKQFFEKWESEFQPAEMLDS